MQQKTNKPKGFLEVICGSMFSGKTEEFMRRLKRAEYAKQNVLTIKHHIDQRYDSGYTCIVSHDGKKRTALPVGKDNDGMKKILELADDSIDIVGLDEIHFFPQSQNVISTIMKLVERGKRVIIAGLELDFRGEPFQTTATLMALADQVTKLKAICVICGDDAHHTQRLIEGRPARYDDPIILVGASEFYEARCRGCFAIDKTTPAQTHVTPQTQKQVQV